MKTFKQFLIEDAKIRTSIHNEALIVLTKIIDMVDDGHIDYSDSIIDINVGKLIHDRKYSKLNIKIVKAKTNDVKIGRHKSDDTHTIFIQTTSFPERSNIDEFLAKNETVKKFKEAFAKFINDAELDYDAEESTVEKINSINSRENFESIYKTIVDKISKVFSQYNEALKSIENKIKASNDGMGDKELLKASANKLKKDMLGSSVEEFKRKALDIIGMEKYKLLNKEFKEKLDSRLENFYENKIK